MGYKPIKARKIYEEVTDSLLEMLRTGQFEPGDKLDSVEQLAKNFSVGRSAIREALSGLRAMGLVEMRQGEGTFITLFDPSKFSLPVATALLMKREDIKELSEVRKILEVGAAGSASMNHYAEDLLPMKQALQAMQDANGEGEVGEKADLDFHLAIANATHNQMLINLMSSVSDIMVESMRETRRLLLYSEEGMTTLYKEHQLIFDAIQSGQSEKAQKHMLDHLLGVEGVLSEYLDYTNE
ncbi:GntR family transcriptional regulator [Virgibacillus phasianinus]|uniref:GntR family transcriptional regulator n=1 Tax=Virgibacillus phasianinus TaxID=2017483 RepID=A0A220U339_9BACI|nr:FadR/GntR family transcriptional regulator [Virgibacillus phasianinus]ASK62455.1 GntR family transcriptional regulator [Virgibacillus phasianinus]